MNAGIVFYINSILLGFGLTMDAFSVSIANGLNEPHMKKGKGLMIAGVFGLFQGIMPLIGWICIHTIVGYFNVFNKFVPYIAFILLVFIGGKMIYECMKQRKEESNVKEKLTIGALLLQGVATSIDALSVGFTIAEYGPMEAFICSCIIAMITFLTCLGGVFIGKTVGNKFSNKFEIIGGIILIFIGAEILITNIF